MSQFDRAFSREVGFALDQTTTAMQDLHDIAISRMRATFEAQEQASHDMVLIAQAAELRAVERAEAADRKCFWLLMLACAGWALAISFGGSVLLGCLAIVAILLVGAALIVGRGVRRDFEVATFWEEL